jgi:2,3-bisphosphoglycerate-independent phosphoglycerate mutase
MDNIGKEHSQHRLAAHGTAVGLSGGLMGNSEVGWFVRAYFAVQSIAHEELDFDRHLKIGAGRVLWQDIVRIDVAIKKKTFPKNETILTSLKRAKDGNRRLHLMGLVRHPRSPVFLS